MERKFDGFRKLRYSELLLFHNSRSKIVNLHRRRTRQVFEQSRQELSETAGEHFGAAAALHTMAHNSSSMNSNK